MTGSAIEGCEEATSPPSLLTKEGDIRKRSPMFYPCQSQRNQIFKPMKSSQKTLLLMMLVTLTFFGGALIYFTMEYLSSVTRGDAPPTPETIHQIGFMFLVVTMMAGFPAVGMGAYVMYIGSRIRATWTMAASRDGISVQSTCHARCPSQPCCIQHNGIGRNSRDDWIVLTPVGLAFDEHAW